MRMAEIEIGERYMVKRWLAPVRGGQFIHTISPGWPGAWVREVVRVTGRDGRLVVGDREEPLALHEPTETPMRWGVRTVEVRVPLLNVIERV